MTDYKLVPVEGLRYTFDGALAECPCCGSLDVGGAHDTVHCQSCGLTVTKPRPLQNAIDAWNARTGRTRSAAPTVQGEPVAWVHPEQLNALKKAKDTSATCSVWNVPGAMPSGTSLRVPLYTTPQQTEQQPAPDVSALVEALEIIEKGEDAGPDGWGAFRWADCRNIARAALSAHRKQGGEV